MALVVILDVANVEACFWCARRRSVVALASRGSRLLFPGAPKGWRHSRAAHTCVRRQTLWIRRGTLEGDLVGIPPGKGSGTTVSLGSALLFRTALPRSDL